MKKSFKRILTLLGGISTCFSTVIYNRTQLYGRSPISDFSMVVNWLYDRFIGMEKNHEYFVIAKSRIEKALNV